MARIFVTGTTDGIGLNAAKDLIHQGHEVVLHARNKQRIAAMGGLTNRAYGVVTGDLANLAEIRQMAATLNEIGPMDAIIHNAGVLDNNQVHADEGILCTLIVNTVAPYMLSLLAHRPKRLIFTSSSMHFGHGNALDDLNWQARRWANTHAYGESKLLVTVLGAALARLWPDTLVNSVDPGWVPTRMGGRSASDDLGQAHLTQNWLATSNDPAAQVSGGYWYHMQRQSPDGKVNDIRFQDRLLQQLAEISGVALTEYA